MVEVWIDGATEGHNGKLGTVKFVGLGIYIPDFGIQESMRVPGISNNEAEFLALIEALEICKKKGVKRVVFYSDSQIVVNRANGQKPKKLKHQNARMDTFQYRVEYLKNYFTDITFQWIPREENKIADYLSTQQLQ